MLFDQRTREKLRAAGLDSDAIRDVEQEVAEDAATEAARVTAFFGGPETVSDAPTVDPEGTETFYSDMDQTHSTATYPEHEVAYVDLFTHSQDIRGYVRFENWGAYVVGARVLSPDVVELELGPTVDDRVRFARERSHLV